MTLLNIAIHFTIGMAISLLGFYFFRKFIRKYFTKHLTYIFLSYWAFCILIFLFLIGSGGATFYIDTTIWYEFGSFIGAFLLAATLLFQIRAFRRQQVEAKFFEMVRYYRDNVDQMKFRNPFKHEKEKHAEGRRVFKLIFDQYKVARGIVDFEKIVASENIKDCLKKPEEYNKYFKLQSSKELSADNKKIFIENEIAYLITFWGVSNGTVEEIEASLSENFKLEAINEKDKVQEYPELKTELIRKVLTCIAFYKCDGNKNENEKCNKDCNANYTNSIYNHKKQSDNRAFVECSISLKKTKFFRGCEFQLGHFFRHLYQTVKFIDKQPSWLFSQDEKYEYVKTLRAQMSNYEQALLFINSLTALGRNWEYSNKEGKRLISEYNLIKNLPQHFIPNMNPKDFYPKVKFDWERDANKVIDPLDKHLEIKTNLNIIVEQQANQLKIEEIESWRKEISLWKLVFMKYPIKEKLLFWSVILVAALVLYFWLQFNSIMWSWFLLIIPGFTAYISVRLSRKHREKIIRDYCKELQIDRTLNEPALSLIQQRIIEIKLGVNSTNKEYIDFLICHFQNKAKKVKYNYPIIIWALSISLSSYLAFAFGVFAKSVNNWEEFIKLSKPLLEIIGMVLYTLAIIEFGLIRIYATHNKYKTIIEVLKNIQLTNLSKKG